MEKYLLVITTILVITQIIRLIILSVGGAIKNIEMDEGNNSYHQFELSNGETRYWKNMSIENLRRLGFYLESEGE